MQPLVRAVLAEQLNCRGWQERMTVCHMLPRLHGGINKVELTLPFLSEPLVIDVPTRTSRVGISYSKKKILFTKINPFSTNRVLITLFSFHFTLATCN